MARSPKKAKTLDVAPIATEIVALVLAHADDDRLRWGSHRTSVHVQVARCLPKEGVPKRTREGRERRLRDAVQTRLLEARWFPLGENRYAQVSTSEDRAFFASLTREQLWAVAMLKLNPEARASFDGLPAEMRRTALAAMERLRRSIQ